MNLSSWPFKGGLGALPGNNPIAETTSEDKALLIRSLSHKHMVETIERFEWLNLPPELNSDLIERIIYFRFKGSLFYVKELDVYMFLPFALKGVNRDTIDSYGRYSNITPVLFTGQWRIEKDGKITKDVSWITNKAFKVVYDLPDDKEEESTDEVIEGEDTSDESQGISDKEKFTVILTDSTLEISQDYTPMTYLARPFIEQMTEIIVLVNIDLINSAKIYTIVAPDEATKESIEHEFSNLDKKILNGQRFLVVTSAVKLNELTGSQAKDSARYFQSYQSIDNLRKDMIGIDNGGAFMKQEHETEMETEINGNNSGGGSPVLNNALRMRQDFAKLANKVFGLDIQVNLKGGSVEDSIVKPGKQSKDKEEGAE